MTKLYGSLTSPFVRHCRIAFLEQDMAFDFVPTDYGQSAAKSPAKRVPFLECEGGMITDSSAILQWVRQEGKWPFLRSPWETNLYCLANTVLDTAINLFLLEKDGITPDKAPYLQRQQSRITSCLEAIEQEALDFEKAPNDGQWRVACMMEWAIYRKRLEFSSYPNLTAFLDRVSQLPTFQETAPPPA